MPRTLSSSPFLIRVRNDGIWGDDDGIGDDDDGISGVDVGISGDDNGKRSNDGIRGDDDGILSTSFCVIKNADAADKSAILFIFL